ncbi:type II toxin-antitoxin system RelB/DinJ family antitoxin [Candidatus Ruthia endofausta]
MTTLLSARIDNDTKIKFVQTCEQIGLIILLKPLNYSP